MGQQPFDHAAQIARVPHFQYRATAVVEVARQAGIAGAVLGTVPDRIVVQRQRIGLREPRIGVALVGETSGSVQYLADHFAQERRLRTGQVIGAVGVEHAAVVFGFEQEVVDHFAGQLFAFVGDQAQHDEIAVPAVHLVEEPTRYYIGVGQIQQTLLRQRRRIELADPRNRAWQRAQFHTAAAGGGRKRGIGRRVRRHVDHRMRPDLGIGECQKSSTRRVSVFHPRSMYASVRAGSGAAAWATTGANNSDSNRQPKVEAECLMARPPPDRPCSTTARHWIRRRRHYSGQMVPAGNGHRHRSTTIAPRCASLACCRSPPTAVVAPNATGSAWRPANLCAAVVVAGRQPVRPAAMTTLRYRDRHCGRSDADYLRRRRQGWRPTTRHR